MLNKFQAMIMAGLFSILLVSGPNQALAQAGENGLIPANPAKQLEKTPDIKGTIVRPRVFFVAPKDRTTLKSPFVVKFGVEGMTVRKADEVVPGTGHFHLIVNSGSVKKGLAIPKDGQHMHFNAGETEAKVKLAPGDYTLTLQFGDGSHVSYGTEMSATINVKVK